VLCGLGADAGETEDGLIIQGGADLAGGEVSSCGDHRIAMAAAVAAAQCSHPLVIRDAQAVNKSYPEFFDDLCALGGLVQQLEP
jgi:3-phosphoshikimate 1-carboxyvinyltransferase